MKVVLQMVGSGTRLDPLRLPLPTYTYLSDDGTNMTADVPSADIPADVASQIDGNGNVPPGALVSWYAHLDQRYKEHRGNFRPKNKQ